MRHPLHPPEVPVSGLRPLISALPEICERCANHANHSISMGAIGAIALNTFREAVRDRVLYSMLLFALALILFSVVLGRIAPGEQERLTVDVGLMGISFMSVLLAIVLGVTNLHKEIERKTVYFILPLPLSRWQFLLGKLLGMAWVLVVTLVLMGGSLLTVAAWHEVDLRNWVLAGVALDLTVIAALMTGLRRKPHVWPTLVAISVAAVGVLLARAAGADVVVMVQGCILVAVEATVITSIALLFSSFSTPLLSGVLTFLIFVAGRQLHWLDQLAARMEDDSIDSLVGVIGAVFPNCYLFVPSVNVLEGRFLVTAEPMAPWAFVGDAALYGFFYAAIVVGLAGIVLWRRDFV